QLSLAPRYLPSFPTRRSSDLGRMVPFDKAPSFAALRAAYRYRGTRGYYRADDLDGSVGGERALDRVEVVSAVVAARASIPIGGRSEEHTSELQSREKLVCRLL